MAGLTDEQLLAATGQQPAPQGLSDEQLLAETSHGPTEDYAPPRPGVTSDLIPGQTMKARTEVGEAKVAAEKPRSFKDKMIGGAEVAASLLSAIPANIGAVAPGVVGAAKDVYNKLATGKDTNEGAAAFGDFAARNTYTPKTEAGQEYAGDVAKAIDASKIPITPATSELSLASGLAKPAMKQAAGAVGREISAVKPAMEGASRAVAKAVGKTTAPEEFTPSKPGMISPEAAALAKRAEDMGIKVPLHTLVDHKLVRMLGDYLADITGKTTRDNRAAWNDYIADQIGAKKTGAVTTENFAEAQNKAGKTIGDIFAATTVPMDESMTKPLVALRESQTLMAGDSPRIVNGWIDKLAELSDKHGGVIPGKYLQQFNNDLGDAIRLYGKAGSGDHVLIENGLRDLQETIIDGVLHNTSEELRPVLHEARKKYAISKVIEPLVAKGDLKGINPSDLLGRLTSTERGKHRMAVGADKVLGDAAKVAQNFMKQNTAINSAERRLALGSAGLAGGAALGGVIPGLAGVAGVAGASSLYNKFGPMIARRIVARSLRPAAKTGPAAKKELEIAGESPWPKREPKEVPPPEPPPTMQLLGKDEYPQPRAKDTERLATRHDIPERTSEFPLRQEVIEQLQPVVDAFREEQDRLQKIINDKYPLGKHGDAARAQAARDLNQLRDEFGAGMRQLGVDSPAEAHGLRRLLYESGKGTKLPIEKSAPLKPGARVGGRIPRTNAKGWELHVDANGNKAYVGPNKEVEEVQ